MERNENGLSALWGGRGSSSARPTDYENENFATEREGCGRSIARNGCGCDGMSGGQRQLAMVYAPMQCFRMLYNHSDALMRGTLFEELDKPLEEVW